ncbi:hypothetical protein ACYSNU_00005 [Enterococcus sp. LJL120]
MFVKVLLLPFGVIIDVLRALFRGTTEGALDAIEVPSLYRQALKEYVEKQKNRKIISKLKEAFVY